MPIQEDIGSSFGDDVGSVKQFDVTLVGDVTNCVIVDRKFSKSHKS